MPLLIKGYSNLVFQITISSPILPGEIGLSDILLVYSKEILSTLKSFSIITKLKKDRTPMR